MFPARRKSRLRRTLTGLAVMVTTSAVLFVLAEIAVRVFVPESTFHFLANIYAPHANPGIAYTVQPGYAGPAFGVPVQANRFGFRGPEWGEQKAPGVFRIALIGDSHAFGYGVPFEQGVGEQLVRALEGRAGETRSYEVLNFGVPGYNAAQEHAVFEDLALGFDPDLVVLVPCNNDADPPNSCDAEGWLHSGPTESVGGDQTRLQDWRSRSFEEFQTSLFGRSRLLVYLRIQWLRYSYSREQAQMLGDLEQTPALVPDLSGLSDADIPSALIDEVFEPLNQILEVCRDRQLPVVVAGFSNLPAWNLLFRKLSRDHEVPYLNLLGLFPEVETYADLLRQFSLGWDAHLGPRAHQRWGTALAELLDRRGLLGR